MSLFHNESQDQLRYKKSHLEVEPITFNRIRIRIPEDFNLTQDVDQRVIERMNQDPYCHSMGIELLEVKSGYSKVSMKVKENMLNFHGIIHGGAIFSLADAAFATASNSHGVTAVALSMEISYRRAAKPGQTLFAEAKEESLGKNTALYHITVTNEQGLVACCHGTVYRKEKVTN